MTYSNRCMFRFGVMMLLFATGTLADVKLPAIFGDHMVLQAGQPIAIWGMAAAGESVTVALGSDKATATAGTDGGWKVSLPARQSGTDLVLKITGKNVVEIKDVVVGEVWVCSGQSNMAMLLKGCQDGVRDSQGANFPMIRTFDVSREVNALPQSDFKGDWTVCSPETAADFSAVAFYFGRDLHSELKVPVGLINSSWAGTRIEPWTAFDSLKLIPGFEAEIAKLEPLRRGDDVLWKEYRDAMARKEQALAEVAAIETNEVLHRQMAAPDLDVSAWPEMNIPEQWEKAGLPDFDGLVWFRKEVELPAGWAGKDLVLKLGPVDEMDSAWFNEARVGGEGDFSKMIVKFWEIPRVYRIPGAAVKAGRNTLMVRVIDTGWAGGIWGAAPADMYLAPADNDADRVSVAGSWRYQVGPKLMGNAKAPVNHATPTALYNAMIHPMINYAIRGAIWYQGESNVTEKDLYTHKKRALIDSWRKAWNVGEFPFLFVQLAPFDYAHTNQFVLPELWNAQREALAIPNTGMAIITDLGNLRDIHPRRKREVGARLALWALAKTYGRDQLVYSGPLVKSAVRDGSKVKVTFDHVGSGLVAREGDAMSWFELAGTNGVFARAQAVIQGADVVVSAGTVVEPVQVRYGWAEEAEVELTNMEGMPASPFCVDVH